MVHILKITLTAASANVSEKVLI